MHSTVRDYEERDRPAIERLGLETVRDGTVFPFEDLAGVLGYWFSPHGRVVVAEQGGEVVGTYALKPNLPGRGAHVGTAGYMVAEARRGQGLGRRLGEHSIALARELGFRALQFNIVVSTNGSAVRLWERLGFTIVGEVPGAFRHPTRGYVSTYLMHRALD